MSTKISFNDFIAKNDTEKINYLLGEKGKWSKGVKNEMIGNCASVT